MFTLSDSNVDDFAMFRYEINSIFKNHQFKDENVNSECFMGPNPLSKTKTGKQFKDLDDKEKLKEEYMDMFRPPGLVTIDKKCPSFLYDNKTVMNCDPTDTVMDKQPWGNAGDLDTKKLEFKKKVEKSIWLTVPTKQLYQRQNIQSELLVKANAKRFEKYDTSHLEKIDRP